jgi:pyridoxamine 5'-phosphate oxidase
MKNSIADLRRDYTRASLDVSNVDSDPVKQFETWFNDALRAEVIEPNAMTLSTVNAQGRPSSRVVLLKGVENRKFVFFTNYQSRKGRELESNAACALNFFWPDLERQVCVQGIADKVDPKISEAYFKSRPKMSQIGAWTSPQSTIIKDRSILEERFAQIQSKYKEDNELPKPHQWGGYEIDPLVIEFWQGRPGRLHDRIEYTKVDGQWKIHRLAP